jgi:hypothetical protein
VEVKGFDEEADEFDLSTVFGREQKSPRIAKTFDKWAPTVVEEFPTKVMQR